MSNIIDIQNLTKQYPNAGALSLNIDTLEIVHGEKFGIFGPNGAGKTTLISILCGIIEPSTGFAHYHLNGHSNTVKSMLTSVGFVPQDFAFYPELTPIQNLRYFGRLYDIPKLVLRDKIDYLLESVGLTHVKNKKINTFSGGMKRRINLAIGLINNPKILFLDEPTVGVDVQSKVAIFKLLDELNANGTTIIYTSHHLKEAEDFCDRIALLDHGKIIKIGSLTNLLSSNNVGNLEELLINLTGNSLRD